MPLYKITQKIMFAFIYFWPQMTPPLIPLNLPPLLLRPLLMMRKNQERAMVKKNYTRGKRRLLINSRKKGHHLLTLTSQLNQREGLSWNHQRRRKRRRKRKTPKLRNRHLRPLRTRTNPVHVYSCKNNNLRILTHALFQTFIHFVLCIYVCYSLLLFTCVSVLQDLEEGKKCSFETHISLILYFHYEDILWCLLTDPINVFPFIYNADSKDFLWQFYRLFLHSKSCCGRTI